MVLFSGEKMNAHHSNESNPCSLCFKKLQDADPALSEWFKRLKVAFPTVHVSISYRGLKEQEQAFAEGKTKLHFPNSPHNAVGAKGKPCSRALDLFNLSEDGVAMFPPLYYAKIWEWCQANKEPIKWGGNFKTLGDSNHFQLV